MYGEVFGVFASGGIVDVGFGVGFVVGLLFDVMIWRGERMAAGSLASSRHPPLQSLPLPSCCLHDAGVGGKVAEDRPWMSM
jgi:hypothetical protein